jgi:ABC-type multidrug transport system permease subunit
MAAAYPAAAPRSLAKAAAGVSMWSRQDLRYAGVRMLGLVVAATLWSYLSWIIAVVLWVLFIYVTSLLAASKGRSPLLWVVLAVFFPMITIIVLLVIPSRSTPAV